MPDRSSPRSKSKTRPRGKPAARTRLPRRGTSRATARRRRLEGAFEGLHAALGNFAKAIALTRVAHGSLLFGEVAWDEQTALAEAVSALDAAYNALDVAITTAWRAKL